MAGRMTEKEKEFMTMQQQQAGMKPDEQQMYYNENRRRGIAAAGGKWPSPLDQLKEVVDAVSVPVQAVGGLSLEQAIACPSYGAPLVVIGAPLAIDADSFSKGKDVASVLKEICEKVHAYGDVPVKGER